ncbi:MSC_0882 family membrane protein [Mycoplasmopsis cynos]|uniref:MSC_0882 family membrane protein n=1 Tax=Mycoplasmopsis cynos TaxID=171284 RepID=UPI002AFE74D4|nr:hypothetical protein [Mycoplasmopsis cynos]WQQ17667.1 hypothetical protein RRG56_03915 [Mycoplasmopsis cynos]
MFKPKRSGQELELNTAQFNIEKNKESKIYLDPQKQLSPNTYSVIKKEKRVRILSAIFWGLIFSACFIGILLNVTLTLNKEDKKIGYYFLLAIPFIISFLYMVKSLIKISGWKKVQTSFRQSYSNADASASSMFVDIYQALVLKKLRLSWGLAFFLTYFSLFNLLVLILKDQVWEVGNNFDKNSATNGINFHFIIDFAKINISLFGNVNLLLIIDGCIIVGAVALYVLIILYDKKRIQDIQGNFGSSEAAISVKNLVEKRRQKENKAWMRTYIIIFILVILLPFVLLIYLIYKKIVRRKA